MATSSSSSSRPERVYHQDYIARIRYSNALPPPATPPKLLEVPHAGIESGEYTATGFASRLAREQVPNVEADGEMGMRLDLVGMPGVFDGDESSIQAPPHPPAPHQNDRPLLRPLATLGKPTAKSTGVSFLRRTEYISADLSRPRGEGLGTPRSNTKSGTQWRKKRPLEDENDPNLAPITMIRNIVKGFDIAYPDEAYNGPDTMTQIRGTVPKPEELAAWNTPKHPTKSHLKLVDTYPVLPDQEGKPATDAYTIIKYSTTPVAATGKYDTRLDVGVLIPLEEYPFQVAEFQAAQAAWESDKTRPQPGPIQDFIHLVPPKDEETVRLIKRKLDIDDPERDSSELYTARNETSGRPVLQYDKLRLWETANSTLQMDTKYSEVALALVDYDDAKGGQSRLHQKAAYYYPIQQRINLRPLRARQGLEPRTSGDTELLHVEVTDPTEAVDGEEAEAEAETVEVDDDDE